MRHLAARPAKSTRRRLPFVRGSGQRRTRSRRSGHGTGRCEARRGRGLHPRGGASGGWPMKTPSRARPVFPAPPLYQGPGRRRPRRHRHRLRPGGDEPARHAAGTGGRSARPRSCKPYDPPYGWNGFSPLERFRHRRLRRHGLRLCPYARRARPDRGACLGNSRRRGGLHHAGGGSFHHVADPARACGETRAARADPGRCPYRHLPE